MTRRQLTLFVDESISDVIESVREKYNPEQFQLIKSHVTLCREDELINIEMVLNNLTKINCGPLAIAFEKVCRFKDGSGVWLPASNHNSSFQDLRIIALKNVVDNPKKHIPHITLMHPRNSICTDRIFEQIEKVNFPESITFKQISLIEQSDGKQWKILELIDLY